MEKNYRLHRITGGDNALPFAYQLLFKHNYLSIGWSDLSSTKFISRVKNEGISVINKKMENLGWGLPRNRWSLYRFIKEIKTGDSILVPYGKNFNVFEIVDDIIYSNETIDTSIYIDWNNNRATLKEGCFYNKENNLIDMGFYRKVKIIEKEIPKDVYANQDLYSRMKIRLTNANISDIKDAIIQAIVRFRENKPINLKEQIIEETAKKNIKIN